VVPQEGAHIDEAAIKAFTIEHGPAFAHPRFVEFRSEIPLSATNKPDRRLLTEEAERIAARRRAAGERA
jgi:long-chain acyl-CoA synthetase